MTAPPDITPRLLTQAAAARYMGVSVNTFRGWAIPRRVLGGIARYDIRDLDRFADDLPYEGECEAEAECDRAFGIG